jgi:2-hydroxychromene-2-carboxylate isomerase
MNVLTVMKAVGNTPTTIECAAKGRYARADLGRWAQRYGMPLNPADMKAVDGEACLRAVLAASSPASANAITTTIFQACWGEGRTLTSVSDIVEVVAAAGIETEGLATRIDAPATVDALAANCEEAAERGVFGSPTIMDGDVMFFGNDRLDFVREHLAQGEVA